MRRAALMVMVIALAGGCQTTSVETSDGRPMPPTPRRVPDAPPESPVNRMAVQYGAKPMDTNGNGFPDEISVQTYLFALPHPTSVYRDGAFEFELNAMHEGQPVTVGFWRFEGQQAAALRHRDRLFGNGYAFRLNLLAAGGGDRLPHSEALMSCRFVPADGGQPVEAEGVYTVQIGSPRMSRAGG